ncbi:hypothetical protein [Halodesulfovibrio spirochaetisodalis]|uniref:Uncharacterized protein n=1 Tax=Halodesulfovibrio spirochaetisodalis TaxID=1560234 RepID=A0A1B7XEN7_9BACT|nr:hypothetical protein [Halodesulfovibrio spirochaetisodalis]OBQ52656.1 hypothetical protein SP90_06695 [Halodesulfovibrio spirochaetisodalis]
MNTLQKVLTVLVMVCALVTVALGGNAEASHRKNVYETKRVSKVYPDLRTLERYAYVAAYKPHKAKRFMHRNHIYKLGKGTRVVKLRSIKLHGVDAVAYEVRIPSRNEYGYVLSHNVKKVKHKRPHHPKVQVYFPSPVLIIDL